MQKPVMEEIVQVKVAAQELVDDLRARIEQMRTDTRAHLKTLERQQKAMEKKIEALTYYQWGFLQLNFYEKVDYGLGTERPVRPTDFQYRAFSPPPERVLGRRVKPAQRWIADGDGGGVFEAEELKESTPNQTPDITN